MNPINFNFGPEVVATRGYIHDSMEERFLREDQMEIDLDSGVTIAIWGNADDGCYHLEAFREYPENHLETVLVEDQQMLHGILAWLIEKNRNCTAPATVTTEAEPTSDPEIEVSSISHLWYYDEADANVAVLA